MNKATNKGRQQDFKEREGNCGIPTVDFFHISGFGDYVLTDESEMLQFSDRIQKVPLRRRQLHKPLLGQDAFCLIGVQAQEHPINLLISGFQPLAFLLCLRSVHQIPALHPAAEPLIERISVLHGLQRQFLNVLQHQIV